MPIKNEEEQAQRVARWLDGPPGTPAPSGVDPEVIEGLIALKPALARPVQLDLDAIIAEVQVGPFAQQDAIRHPKPANRPMAWWLTGGGASALAMAAAGLLFIRTAEDPSLLNTRDLPIAETKAIQQEQKDLTQLKRSIQVDAAPKSASPPSPIVTNDLLTKEKLKSPSAASAFVGGLLNSTDGSAAALDSTGVSQLRDSRSEQLTQETRPPASAPRASSAKGRAMSRAPGSALSEAPPIGGQDRERADSPGLIPEDAPNQSDEDERAYEAPQRAPKPQTMGLPEQAKAEAATKKTVSARKSNAKRKKTDRAAAALKDDYSRWFDPIQAPAQSGRQAALRAATHFMEQGEEMLALEAVKRGLALAPMNDASEEHQKLILLRERLSRSLYDGSP